MNESIIKLDHVSKFYKLYDSPKLRLKEALNPFGKKYHKEFYAVRDISFELNKGQVLGIVGRNGSGKSTLLKLIAGALVPSSGSVSVAGNVNALLELGSGLNPQFTGLQNIYFMGRIQGFRQSEMESKVEEIIEFSELGEYIHQPLRSYSSGMKSRLAFSIATTIQPEILILDEVLSVGDVLFRRKSFARMEKLISENRTVLFVSHNEQSVKSICSRAILLDRGKLLYDGKPDDTVNMYLELLHSRDPEQVINRKVFNAESGSSSVGEIPVDEDVIQTKSRKYVKIHEADIVEVTVRDIEDYNPLKILIKDGEYIIRVKVTLYEAYTNLSVAVTIKNELGIVITGKSSRLAEQTGRNKTKESNIVFDYKFTCILNPSIYFIDVGLAGDVDGKNEFLCYIVDSMSINVTGSKEKNASFGFVDLLEPVAGISD